LFLNIEKLQICAAVPCYCNGFATTGWPKIIENTLVYDFTIVDLTPVNFTTDTVHIWKSSYTSSASLSVKIYKYSDTGREGLCVPVCVPQTGSQDSRTDSYSVHFEYNIGVS